MKFVFLGVQGSGKSTQAKILAEKLNLPYLETSQLLRKKLEDEDEDAKHIKEAFETGNLVPVEITVRTLKKRIALNDCKDGYVLDGFPRNREQLESLDSDINKVFYVTLSDEEAVRRLSLRGRYDDKGEALKRRIELYHNETEPILEKFREKGILEEVNGERTIEDIAEDIKERLNNNNGK